MVVTNEPLPLWNNVETSKVMWLHSMEVLFYVKVEVDWK